MLNLIFLFPGLTLLLLCFFKRQEVVRWISLLGSILQLLFVLSLLSFYLQDVKLINASTTLYESSLPWFKTLNLNYHTGVDGIGLAMILLTAIISFTGVLASWNISLKPREFYFNLFLLSTGAYGFFIAQDLFTLFFFLEIAIIPKFLLISIWGSGKHIASANKLVLMLMAGSAMILVSMLGIYYNGSHCFDISVIAKNGLPVKVQQILFPLLFTGFGIFTAMFPFHTWVPDGHSSAPTAASMFLSGISMKMGAYGCLRVAMALMPQAAINQAWIFLTLALIGVLYAAFATVRQTDLKYINAYSSISHTSLVLIGILAMNATALNGAVMQMFSHGIMTALFFALIGMIYGRTHTRIVSEMSGLQKVLPFIGTAFIIAGLCSLGLPGLSGFPSEAKIFFGSYAADGHFIHLITIFSILSIVITAVYILRMSGSVIFGPLSNEFSPLKDGSWYEKYLIVILVGTIIFVGIYPTWISDLIQYGVNNIMLQIKDHSVAVVPHGILNI